MPRGLRIDGIVVAPAGIGTGGLYSETFDPMTELWSTGWDPTRTSLFALGAVLLPGDRVLVVGGQDATGILASAWLSGPEPTACDDGNPCTNDVCDAVAGCMSVPNTLSCDDGDDCTTGEVCSASVHPSLANVSGEFFEDCNIQKPSRHARDEAMAERLWDVTEAIVEKL